MATTSNESFRESQQHLIVHSDHDENECIDGVEEIAQNSNNNDNASRRISNERDHNSQVNLPKYRIYSYAIGHFYNDLCASMWFTYLLIFLEKVVQLTSWQAGLLMFIGQVTDAICTPLVGLLSDHSFLPGFLMRFGRRKSWHIIGTCFVSISFPLIFSGCILCQHLPLLKLIWFIPPIMLFQFGWASVQISHLAMIPELTTSEHIRLSMTSLRYGFTVIANLSVFVLLYLFLSVDDQHTMAIGPADIGSFRKLGIICVGLGLISTSIFYLGVKEPTLQRRMSQLNLLTQTESISHLHVQKMAWKNWFSHRHFYQTAFLYLFSRVYINVSQVYFSFYITETQNRVKQFVALLPLTTFLSSFVVSFLLGFSKISKRATGKPVFLSGAFFGLVNCVLLFIANPDWLLYGMASLLGITQAMVLICSLNTTATLININTESAAFVYGAMSFLDKLSNGLVVQIVELFNPLSHKSLPLTPAEFYRVTMSIIPGACVIAICIILFSMDFRTLGNRRAAMLTRNSFTEEISPGDGNFEIQPALDSTTNQA